MLYTVTVILAEGGVRSEPFSVSKTGKNEGTSLEWIICRISHPLPGEPFATNLRIAADPIRELSGLRGPGAGFGERRSAVGVLNSVRGRSHVLLSPF